MSNATFRYSYASSQCAPTLDQERDAVLRLQAGDRQAASLLYRWFAEPLYRSVLLPRVQENELASDLLSETFVRAIARIHSFRWSNVSFFFWLRRIAVHLAIDTHRQRSRHEMVDVDDVDIVSGLSTDLGVDFVPSRTRIETTLGGLSERYAQALRLRLLEDESREECARRFGISVGAFDVLLHRASKAFRAASEREQFAIS